MNNSELIERLRTLHFRIVARSGVNTEFFIMLFVTAIHPWKSCLPLH